MGSEAAGGLDRAGLEALMSNLTQRTFLMRDVHDDAPVLFRTRWALSYLRGPLTLAEIGRLTASGATGPAAAQRGGEARPPGEAATPEADDSAPAAGRPRAQSAARPVLQYGVPERFLAAAGTRAGPPHYTARLAARVRAHYVDARAGLDTWQTTHYLAPLGAGGPDWSAAEVMDEPGPQFSAEAAAGATFEEPPAAALSTREHKRWAAALEDHVYRNAVLELLSCPSLKATAAPGTSEGEFRARLALELREKRDAEVEALRRKYASRLGTLEDRARRAAQRVERERSQASSQTLSSALSVGGSLLGALFGGGRRRSAVRQASTAARSVGRASKERADVEHAEADERALRAQITALEAELAAEVAGLESRLDPQAIRIERVPVKPRKADLAVDDLALAWRP
jgi:hypothetical protein